MKKTFLLFLISFAMSHLPAQQTVGLFSIEPGAYEGYNLFAPFSFQETYLIDNCGRKVHSWSSDYLPGLVSYLLEDGNLLRAGIINNPDFGGGGTGGMIEILDWNGDNVWKYAYSSPTYCQHHDVEMMPNGNVLAVAWEYRSRAQAIAAGRDPDHVNGWGIWPEKIVEIQPTGDTTGTVVWEWNIWDHLIQDFDSTKDNYGVVSDHPELMDINYPPADAPTSGNADWLHANSVDYNEDLDQIVISLHHNSEFWIIDHSTTTAEAAGHTGGNSGKGGDLLYRWGNPEAYKRGDSTDQKLFFQHDARWIQDSLPNAGMIMVFNNGNDDRLHSSVEILEPPVDGSGNYSLNAGQAYGPETPYWSYDGAPNDSWYSYFISGAHPLPNGNVLICDGPDGRFFEVNSTGVIQWEYVNPVTNTGPIDQGDYSWGNQSFRVHRYSPDYPGLAGKNLTPGDRIEGDPDPLPFICTTTSQEGEEEIKLSAYPNPVTDQLHIEMEGIGRIEMEVYDLMGRQVLPLEKVHDGYQIDTRSWSPGIYMLRFLGDEPVEIKILKQ